MKILTQAGIIFGLCLIGEAIAAVLPFAFPASVICMILLFLCFLFRWIKPDSLRETAGFLLENMAFFFIPAGVGIMESFAVVKDAVFQLVLICVVSTFLTFAATAYTIRLVSALQKKLGKRGTAHE